MKCRQCLIHLARLLGKPEIVPNGQEQPQRDNFVGWSEHIANSVAPGESAERVRGHLKAIAKSTWDLAAWLTHASGAKWSDAEFVLDATQSVAERFGSAVIRHESGSPESCPACGSYSLGVDSIPNFRDHMCLSVRSAVGTIAGNDAEGMRDDDGGTSY